MENPIQLMNLKAIQKEFNAEFDILWKEFIISCDNKMAQAKQLNIGNHTRPFLAYLGSAVNSDFADKTLIKQMAQLSVCIEAIHKASVIIDDIIDGDSLRRGIPCMHFEFGEYETVFFAVCMLARGLDNVNHILYSKKPDTIHETVLSLLCDTIYSMCHGAIMEITSNFEKQRNLEYVKEIIDLETVKLIENSLYIGFLYTDSSAEELGTAIQTIGKKCGYIFQVMNDMEAFCNPNHILNYKGNINTDFLRSRKSIILPYLYNACKQEDKIRLAKLSSDNELSFQSAKEMFDTYNISSIVLKDINEIYDSIFELLISVKPNLPNKQWHDIFSAYLKYSKAKYQAFLDSGAK